MQASILEFRNRANLNPLTLCFQLYSLNPEPKALNFKLCNLDRVPYSAFQDYSLGVPVQASRRAQNSLHPNCLKGLGPGARRVSDRGVEFGARALQLTV